MAGQIGVVGIAALGGVALKGNAAVVDVAVRSHNRADRRAGGGAVADNALAVHLQAGLAAHHADGAGALVCRIVGVVALVVADGGALHGYPGQVGDPEGRTGSAALAASVQNNVEQAQDTVGNLEHLLLVVLAAVNPEGRTALLAADGEAGVEAHVGHLAVLGDHGIGQQRIVIGNHVFY